jgi:hypothetical protein
MTPYPKWRLPPAGPWVRPDAHGAVAQLGERRVRNAEVRGSIPLGSTNTGRPRIQDIGDSTAM